MVGGVGSATGAIRSGMHAINKVVQQERDVAAIAQRDEERKPDFDGNGSKEPHRGQVIDITA